MNPLPPPPRSKPIPLQSARPTSALGLFPEELAALFSATDGGEGGGMPYAELFREPPSPRLLAWARERGLSCRVLTPLGRERGEASEKFLFGLADGRAIESVLIRRHDGFTACISSQVGCAFACRFCASGQAGLKRHLTPGEIVEQVVRLGGRVNRIVFMGIGEPLANYDNVMKAIRILRDRRGMDFPTTGITVSTIGIPEALRRLREEHLALNLTISLHATTQETRDRLVPGARRHRLEDVVNAALSWADRHNRVATFAYLLLPGVNDAPDDARRLCAMLAGKKARVNLMRWNAVEGIGLPGTDERRLGTFRDRLTRGGVAAVVRDTRGRDIDAACGQLWLRDLRGAPVAAQRAPDAQGSGPGPEGERRIRC